jgi:hypothetical protein
MYLNQHKIKFTVIKFYPLSKFQSFFFLFQTKDIYENMTKFLRTYLISKKYKNTNQRSTPPKCVCRNFMLLGFHLRKKHLNIWTIEVVFERYQSN